MSLASGVSLLSSLVPWYFSAVGYSLSSGQGDGAPWWFPVFGIVAIISVASSVWFIIKRWNLRLFWILLPMSMCFALVFVSGLFLGKMPDPTAALWVATAMEAAGLVTFVWLARPGWLAGASLATFCVTVWLAALFISSMSFTNSWL